MTYLDNLSFFTQEFIVFLPQSIYYYYQFQYSSYFPTFQSISSFHITSFDIINFTIHYAPHSYPLLFLLSTFLSVALSIPVLLPALSLFHVIRYFSPPFSPSTLISQFLLINISLLYCLFYHLPPAPPFLFLAAIKTSLFLFYLSLSIYYHRLSLQSSFF